MNWFLAPSLRALFAEVNHAASRRSKGSDGTIGDLRHSARTSDHNPDPHAGGVVRAADVTHDPTGGCDCNRLASTIRTRRDPRGAPALLNPRRLDHATGPPR